MTPQPDPGHRLTQNLYMTDVRLFLHSTPGSNQRYVYNLVYDTPKDHQ